MRWTSIFLGSSLLVSFAGCSATTQERSVKESGFLGDYYSKLRPGKGDDEAVLVYKIDQNAEIYRDYDKLLFEPITVFPPSKSVKKDDKIDTREELADYLTKAVTTKLREIYELVDEPGPGVLRIQAAITEADPSNIVMKGSVGYRGRASIEAKSTDSQTGKLFVAAMDRRLGRYAPWFEKATWQDVEHICGVWIERLLLRLEEEGFQTKADGGKKSS